MPPTVGGRRRRLARQRCMGASVASRTGLIEHRAVHFIGEHGAATLEAVARNGGCDKRAASLALESLLDAAIIERTRLLAGRPALYSLTSAGWRACGFPPPRPRRPSASSFEHSAALAGAAATLGASGWVVLGERRYRAVERVAGDPLGSVSIGPRLHRPDLVVLSGRRAYAVEVELTVKAPARLERICRAYLLAAHLDGAIYFAAPAARRAVERAAARAGAGDVVRVLALDDVAALAP